MASPCLDMAATTRDPSTGEIRHCEADRRREIGTKERDCIILISFKAIRLGEFIVCEPCSLRCCERLASSLALLFIRRFQSF